MRYECVDSYSYTYAMLMVWYGMIWYGMVNMVGVSIHDLVRIEMKLLIGATFYTLVFPIRN